jgi:hypothetical protein
LILVEDNAGVHGTAEVAKVFAKYKLPCLCWNDADSKEELKKSKQPAMRGRRTHPTSTRLSTCGCG